MMSKHPGEKLARFIDHTLLRADATYVDIARLCQEAIEHRFAAVCVNPHFVSMANDVLHESLVKVCTVVDFPLGAGTGAMKAFAAIRYAQEGADELDMVMNLSAMKSKDYKTVEEEIRQVVSAAPEDVLVKVILETCYLTDDEIREACRIAHKAGAFFVKTSTGFGSGGATVEAVRIMHETVGGKMGIKASGGIRDIETALAMIEAGATRIGTSSGLKIVGAE
ncbi:MAG: deoxyribose-phosphate aldolase [Planctomycetota bacterium]|jgi:deoxyribose-phosphate aldolase